VSEPLTDVDVRVLGSLIEKERTTPEYYPLSLNALINACNQSSNREPVVKYDEATVTQSTDALRQRGLVRATRGMDARVTKYGHRVPDIMGLTDPELAVFCVLLLRGPQTAGELRTRTTRMHAFEDLGAVDATLNALTIKEFVARLPRQPGQKEERYAHLLAGDVADMVQTHVRPAASKSGDTDRIAQLEENVEELRKELADVRAQMEAFRAQFE
jgi:uncharacterized protein YceH (UPF0502 family)